MGFSYTSWNTLREHWTFFYLVFLSGSAACVAGQDVPLLFKKITWTEEITAQCFYFLGFVFWFCFVPLGFFGGDGRTNPRVMLNEVSVQPKVLPGSAGNRDRAMQLIPQIKLSCKEQPKNNSRNESELCTDWNQIVRELKCVCSYPFLRAFLPSLCSSLWFPLFWGLRGK